MKSLLKKALFYLIILLCLFSCNAKQQHTNNHLLQIKPQTFTNTLYYSGTIKPLHTMVIISPTDGIITERFFAYTDIVKKNQLLFSISSTKILADYKSALFQYIKAKNDFNNNQTQLTEAKFLYKNQLISADDYKTKQSNYYAAQLALLQAKDSLEKFLKEFNIQHINLYSLSIDNIDKINQAMHTQLDSLNLRVVAKTDGIILSPNKTDEETKKLSKGDAVKQGDVLALIGDMSGISVNIKVNELTINQLNIGQKVNLSGIAFPEYNLVGQIIEINRQGDTSNNGMPTFSVEIGIPNLTLAQQKSIHVGMSVKAEIAIAEKPEIIIPITAISEKNGLSYTKLFDSKTKKTVDIPIKVGRTTADSIVVLAGLKIGDQIVIPD